MLEVDLRLSAEQALGECCRRGLVVRSERELAGRAGSPITGILGFRVRPGLSNSTCGRTGSGSKCIHWEMAAGRSRWPRSLPAWSPD